MAVNGCNKKIPTIIISNSIRWRTENETETDMSSGPIDSEILTRTHAQTSESVVIKHTDTTWPNRCFHFCRRTHTSIKKFAISLDRKI